MIHLDAKLMTLALIGCVIAFPIQLHKWGQNDIIGYRAVFKEQEAEYNKKGTLTFDSMRMSAQISTGFYTTPCPGDWISPWYCVIFADSDALNRISKAWVLPRHDDKNLWYKLDTVIDNYIKQLKGSWTPKKTLHFAIIDSTSRSEKLQMVILLALLNSAGGGMGISVYCKEKVADLPSHCVNYNDWHENIKGDRR